MDILIFGTGGVGSTLGQRLAEGGHRITYITRDPAAEKVTSLLAGHPGEASAAPYDDIPVGAQAAIVALPYSVALATLEPIAGDLAGLALIDATNPFKRDGSYGVPGSSGAEQIAAAVPGAHVVKAFNTVGTAVMANPAYDRVAADLVICGDSPTAKELVQGLAEALGFNVIDVGELTMAAHLESMAVVWIAIARQRQSGSHAWKFITR